MDINIVNRLEQPSRQEWKTTCLFLQHFQLWEAHLRSEFGSTTKAIALLFQIIKLTHI